MTHYTKIILTSVAWYDCVILALFLFGLYIFLKKCGAIERNTVVSVADKTITTAVEETRARAKNYVLDPIARTATTIVPEIGSVECPMPSSFIC